MSDAARWEREGDWHYPGAVPPAGPRPPAEWAPPHVEAEPAPPQVLRPARRTAGRGWAAAFVVQLAVLAAIVLHGHTETVSATEADIAADRGAGPVIPVQQVVRTSSPPVVLSVSALKIKTRLLGVRKDLDGRLQVPEDPQRAAWYSQGPAPGDAGPAVLVGHVDSYVGPGIFVGLHTLQPGDEIDVRRADGTTVAFAVRTVKAYSKRNFPTQLVYRGDGTESLRLITCGGNFDRQAKSYLDNIVVTAAPMSPSRPAAAAAGKADAKKGAAPKPAASKSADTSKSAGTSNKKAAAPSKNKAAAPSQKAAAPKASGERSARPTPTASSTRRLGAAA